MKTTEKIFKATAAVVIALSAAWLTKVDASAQSAGVSVRTSAEVDWKIRKGLHLSGGYELRTKNSLTGVERHQASVGIEYKVCNYFKIGGEYIFIGHFNSANTFKPRHRFSLNMTGQYDTGNWKFSLREKLQLTHYAYDLNEFQDVPNAIQLKSRFTVKYQGFRHIEPFVYVELRNIFNAPKCSATWSETSAAYTDYKFLGYNHAYLNRVRTAAGFDWNITRAHSIEFTLMYNWVHSLEIDTNKEGTVLKSLYWKTKHEFPLCVGYKFSF